MIKVGLLGAGRIGNVHAKSIAANAQSQLVAISDFHPAAAETLAAAYGAKARSTEDIIADPSIDAVLIATSTDTHSNLIEAATAAGKAVLCEKPVDLDLERALASTVGRLKDEIGDRLDADARTIDGDEYTLEIRRSSQTRLDTAAARGLISQSLGAQALQSVTVKTDITAQFYRKRGL